MDIRKEITYKEIREMVPSLLQFPKLLLRAWGFDPNESLTYLYDDVEEKLIITQKKADDGDRTDATPTRRAAIFGQWKDLVGRRRKR